MKTLKCIAMMMVDVFKLVGILYCGVFAVGFDIFKTINGKLAKLCLKMMEKLVKSLDLKKTKED